MVMVMVAAVAAAETERAPPSPPPLPPPSPLPLPPPSPLPPPPPPMIQHRLVIFVGPHKSASSTVQELLVQYATGRRKYRKVKAFQRWRWPVVRQSSIPARKQWARLVYRNNRSHDHDHHHTINQTTHHQDRQNEPEPEPKPEEEEDATTWRDQLHTALTTAFQHTSNVAVGSEELDRFGSVPWSHWNGIDATRTMIDWAVEAIPANSTLQVDVVVNYRTPRRAQWISIWKQLQSLEESVHHRPPLTYPQWVCQAEEPPGRWYDAKVWEYLDCVANPLGLAEALFQSLSSSLPTTNTNTNTATTTTTSHRHRRRFHWKVSLMDMGGIQRQGLDIAHVSACDILGVPCTQGWIHGINRTLLVNLKSRDLDGVTSGQLKELEWLLRQRDCAYQESFGNPRTTTKTAALATATAAVANTSSMDHFSILYGNSLWMDCPDDTKGQEKFRNTTYLLQLIQSQFGCGPSRDVSNNGTLAPLVTNKYMRPDTTNDNNRETSAVITQEHQDAPTAGVHVHVRQSDKLPSTSTTQTIMFTTRSISLTSGYDWMIIQLLQWLFIGGLFGTIRHVRRRKLNRRRV